MSFQNNFLVVYEVCKSIFSDAKNNYGKLDDFTICLETLRYGKIKNKSDFDSDEKLIEAVSHGLKGKGNCYTSSCYIANALKSKNIDFSWVHSDKQEQHSFIVVKTDDGMILMDASRGFDIEEPLFFLKSSVYVFKSKLQFFYENNKIFQFRNCILEKNYDVESNSLLKELRKDIMSVESEVTKKLSTIALPSLPKNDVDDIYNKIINVLDSDEMFLISKDFLIDKLKKKEKEVNDLAKSKNKYELVLVVLKTIK
jgi:hypothetical protein